MTKNIFDDFDEQSQEAFQGLRFISFEDIQSGIIGEDPFAEIRTNKSLKSISNEYALSRPFGKRSSFYKTTFVDQYTKDQAEEQNSFEVKIRILVEDDANYVYERYRKEVVESSMIKLYLIVKDEGIINKQEKEDIRHANIRTSNILEFVGVVLGDKIYDLFTDHPEKLDRYVSKLANDFIEDDAQLPFVKEALNEKFNYYMEHKRSNLFPLGDIAQMIQQELKKDLQEFWKPVLASLANETRKLKIEDEKYWQPYTQQGVLKRDKAFEPLIGEGISDAQSYITNFLKPFDDIDEVLKDYLNLNKIQDGKNLSPGSQSKLKRALVKIYELFKGIFGYFRAGIINFIERIVNKVYELNALLVGIINGVIEFVASLFDLMGFLAGLMSGDAHLLWQAVKKEFKTLKEKGAFTYLFEVLGKFFADIGTRYKTSQTRYKLLKHLGEDLIGIVEFLLGALATAKGAKGLAAVGKKSYDAFKKKVDEIIGKRKKEFDDIEKKKRGKYFIKSFLESEALTLEELLEWEKRIKIISKNKCRFKVANKNKRILKYMEENEVLAYFDGNEVPPIIWYKEGATKYVIMHEYYHLEEFMKIGKKEFLRGVFGNEKEWHINNILREKYVYERILENAVEFSQAELKNAARYYINEILKPAVEAGVEIIPEYIVKIKK